MTHLSGEKGFVAVPATIADANEPISTGAYRFIADNALHMGDVCGRVFVNDQWPAGIITNDPGTGGYNKIKSFGPFRLTVGPDGVAYPVRIRIAGMKDGKAGSVKFRVVLSPVGISSVYSTGANSTESATTTLTTSTAWLTTTSTLLSLSRGQTAQCVSTESSSDDGTAQTSVVVYKAMIDVYGANVTLAAEPMLTALYAAEYVGV